MCPHTEGVLVLATLGTRDQASGCIESGGGRGEEAFLVSKEQTRPRLSDCRTRALGLWAWLALSFV